MFLHIVASRDVANTYHGTYKDMVSRIDWLRRCFPGYHQMAVNGDDPTVIDQVAGNSSPVGALVEYSYHPRIVRRIKQRWPTIPVAVRCINLEPLQHFDNHGWWPGRGPLWLMYGMMRLAVADMQSKRFADTLLCINEWEMNRYWRWLPGRATVEWLPYRCPDHLVPSDPLPYRDRRTIACMPTSQENRKSRDLVARFNKLAIAMRQRGSHDEFTVTGNLEGWALPPCTSVNRVGFVEHLGSFMGTCKAVAMLSPLGFGFKTTIGDALAAGAHVLVHPALLRRCPAIMQPHLIAVDGKDPDSVKRALKRMEDEPDGLFLQQIMVKRVEESMSRLFGGLRSC